MEYEVWINLRFYMVGWFDGEKEGRRLQRNVLLGSYQGTPSGVPYGPRLQNGSAVILNTPAPKAVSTIVT
jgi:hypothetical protein